MNAPARYSLLPDVQSEADARRLDIDAVGIGRLRYPVAIRSGERVVSTVAEVSMTVALDAGVKGTHMSRFVELLEAQDGPIDARGFERLVRAMLERLHAKAGAIEMDFPYFAGKSAPVSGARSLLDHDVRWRGAVSRDGRWTFAIRVCVPATSLCPCSKRISDHGAHNQRSLICIDAEVAGDITIDELVAIAESAASCPVYGLLKRADEKFVTERAYENPKFVEDQVRDAALALEGDSRVRRYTVEVENFESIHNHSAIARIERAPAHEARP